jgi:hypothetical protein
MCHRARCRECGKTTWRGCGAHVALVKASVPPDLWCPGHPDSAKPDGLLRRWWGR